MYLTVIAGETGSGKSSIAKSIVRRSKHVGVYDVQKEYGLETFPKSRERFCMYPPDFTINDFIKSVQHAKGYLFVIEESTGIFRGTVGKAFIQQILGKRHTGNRFLLLFHQLHRIPPELYEFIDTLIIFKTGDLEKNIRSKYPDLLDRYRHLQTSNRKVPEPDKRYMINEYIVVNRTNLSKNYS